MNAIVQHSSKNNELYTPSVLVEPSQRVLEHIHLDPASSELANELVQAANYWTEAHGVQSLLQPWGPSKGEGWNIFLNPPGGKLHPQTLEPLPRDENGNQVIKGVALKDVVSAAATWWTKLIIEYQAGRARSAIFICFSLAIFRTAQDEADAVLPPFAFPFCVPRDRINYDKVVDNGEGVLQRVPTKGAPADSAIIYLPPKHKNWEDDVRRFVDAFRHLGHVRQ